MRADALIELLKQLPPDADVVVWDTHGTNDAWTEPNLQLVEYRGQHLLEATGLDTRIVERPARSESRGAPYKTRIKIVGGAMPGLSIVRGEDGNDSILYDGSPQTDGQTSTLLIQTVDDNGETD